jgi:hypothetical protein
LFRYIINKKSRRIFEDSKSFHEPEDGAKCACQGAAGSIASENLGGREVRRSPHGAPMQLIENVIILSSYKTPVG